ncbi:MAG: ribosomal L7Ae/L30e/S12e/Gadd45 family protein [Bacilli bacterium]|nr:ribosomal L7Ae/L30e/S12e/Gadd45 family protein [Bacilli bacterium]
MNKKSLNYLGIAKRSGNILCGTDMVVKSLSGGKIKLILLASDASANTKDKIIKKAYFYEIPVMETFTSSDLSKAVGKDHIMVMALIDEGLTKAFLKEVEREVAYEG